MAFCFLSIRRHLYSHEAVADTSGSLRAAAHGPSQDNLLSHTRLPPNILLPLGSSPSITTPFCSCTTFYQAKDFILTHFL